MPQQHARPDSSARRRRRLVVVAVAVLALAGLVATACRGHVLSGSYGTYVCARCGAAEREARCAVLGLTYYDATDATPTPVSQVLDGRAKQRCAHEWHLITAERSWGTSLGWQGHADTATSFGMMYQLAYDEDFARELRQVPEARAVWQALWRSELASERETERLLSDWWWPWNRRQPLRQPFAQWWASQEDRIRQLGSAHAR